MTLRNGRAAAVDWVNVASLVLFTVPPTDRALAGWDPGLGTISVDQAAAYIEAWPVRPGAQP